MDMEWFSVRLNFSVTKVRDDDLRRIINDATQLLGLPFSSAYAIKVIDLAASELHSRAETRLKIILGYEKERPVIQIVDIPRDEYFIHDWRKVSHLKGSNK